jgi:CheY-like chemotaxis protein
MEVDDDEEIRESVAEALVGHGYAVLLASNGREALDTLSGGPRPSLILLDITMPQLSGNDVLERLAAHAALRVIPVVVLSAVEPRKKTAQVRDVLRKPVSLDVLLESVDVHRVDAAAEPARDAELTIPNEGCASSGS